MLTEALFFVAYLVLLPVVFMFPYAGILAYEWLQYMPPYAVYNAYGLGNFSIIIGGLGIGLWFVKGKKYAPKPIGLIVIFVLYFIWVNITQLTSIVGAEGYNLWDRTWKVLLITFLLSFMAGTRARIEAFMWVVCLSIGNFIVSGAIKTILSGGGGETVVGAASSILADRVNFAIAITSVIPIIRYLRDHATLIRNKKYVRLGLDFLTLCCILATIGTQARTGFVALGVLAIFYFIKSKKKFQFALVVPVIVGLFLIVAPKGYFERMNTITTYQNEGSAMGRIDSWKWGWNFTLQHPIFGGGFHSYVLHHDIEGSNHYLEAHNTLFETMADHGFIGLGLLLMLYLGTILNCQKITSRARKLPDMEWAADLGIMLQLALWTFITGSQFLSAATHSMQYELAGLSMALRGIVEARYRQLAPASALESQNPITPIAQLNRAARTAA